MGGFGPRILVIADDPMFGEAVSRQFADSGFTVGAAASAAEGLSDAATHPPDLIVLDGDLPDADALDVLTMLKTTPATRTVPVLMVTEERGEDAVVIGLALGADDCVGRPVSARQLVVRGRRLLDRRDRGGEGARGTEFVASPLPVSVSAPDGAAESGAAAGSRRCPNCFQTVVLPPSGLCPGCQYSPASPLPRRPILPPGTLLLGRYRIGRLLGRGGFGVTYLGWDDQLEAVVAVKEYFPFRGVVRAADSLDLVAENARAEAVFLEGRRHFLSEAKHLARFRDIREVVAVYDYFSANNTSYIVMEYLRGHTLREIVQSAETGRLDWYELQGILMPVLTALDRLHQRSFIHRDVSPDNIMLCRGIGTKILDFGAGQFWDTRDHDMLAMVRRGFAPIEQCEGGQEGPWTDVYGASATIYYALTGTAPVDVRQRINGVALPDLVEAGVAVSDAVSMAVRRGLSVAPEDRLRSVRELCQALSGSSGQVIRD